MNFTKKDITDGVSLLCVNANQFKTNEIAVSFALPLKNETASANALMINLLSRRGQKYPTLLSLNKELASLYGANLLAAVSKIGDCQVLKLGITCIDDRFSIDGKSISLSCVELLLSLIFEPKFGKNDEFFTDDIESEKRVLKEKLEAEDNEKRTYVLRQTEKLMFENEPYGINRYGTVDDIAALTGSDVKKAWQNALASAKIMVTTVGSIDADKAYEYISNAFSGVQRAYQPIDKPVIIPKCDKVKEHMERLDVKQGKLVLGFRVDLDPDDEKMTTAMLSFCDVFGGGPYSKLFANVREKLSLCYYCSSRYIKKKSAIIVQSGCNEENMSKAVDEIMNQLDVIKNGDFEEEFNSSKAAVSDSYLSFNDAPEALEAWYSNQIIADKIKTPEQAVKDNNDVTIEQVRACAELLSLDTVYKLSSPREVQ